MSNFPVSVQPIDAYSYNPMGTSESSMSTMRFGVCVGVGSFAFVAFLVLIVVLIIWIWTARKNRSTRKRQSDVEIAESALRIDELTKQLDAAKSDIKNMKLQADDKEKELREVKEQAKSHKTRLENANRDMEVKLANFQRQYQDLAMQKKQVESAKWEAERERDNFNRKSHSLMKELQEKQRLLDGRTEELRGAQAFLTTADQYAVADVIRLVNHLNAEIMQVAAAMGDGLEVEKFQNPTLLDQGNEVTLRVEQILGVAITKLLRRPGDHLSILVQTAFQTSMVSYTKRITSSWGSDTNILSRIYSQVRETELQPVSARWKQLTKATLERLQDGRPNFLPGLVGELGDILIAAGYEEGAEQLKQRIASRFGNRLNTVLKLVQDLNDQIGQGFTSCDLELLFSGPDMAFDGAIMEDALQPLGSSTPRRNMGNIVYTTDLGLRRSEKIKDGRRTSVLLKAKVILPSGLEEIIGGPMV